jgi:Lar family restriction alleviation protein
MKRKITDEPYEQYMPGTVDPVVGLVVRPCPFCGHSRPRIDSPDGNHMYVLCRGCEAHGPIELERGYCIDRWNKVAR